MHLNYIKNILGELLELIQVQMRAEITLNDLPQIFAEILNVLL